MYGVRLIAVLWTLSIATAAFRTGGTAPYANVTFIKASPALPASAPSSAIPSATRPPHSIYSSRSISGHLFYSSTYTSKESGYASPTGQGSVGPSSSTNPSNNFNANSSCTVNIHNATLEWWYAATYNHYVGTLASSAPNFTNNGQYLTFVPNTATFDASYTISDQVASTETSSYDSEWDTFWTFYDTYSITPTAAATSIITQDGTRPLPSGNVIPAKDYAHYILDYADLPPASVAIAGVANTTNTTSAITSATPFIYITAYEVESAINGSTSTNTVTLDQPSVFEYAVKDVQSSTSATGTVPGSFLQNIPQSSCAPGVVDARVTVLVVVYLSYLHFPHYNPFFVHFESSASGFGSDLPVNAQGTSTGVPFVASWDFPSSGSGETTLKEAGPQPSAILQTQNEGSTPTTDEPAPGSTAASNDQWPNQPAAGSTAAPAGHNGEGGFPNIQQPTSQTVGVIGTNPIIVAPSSVVVVGSQTLEPGGPAIIINGSPVSLVASATAIIIGSTTSALPLVAVPGSNSQTIGNLIGAPIIVYPSSNVVIAGQTLQAGGSSVTLGGNPVSLAPSATAIIVGTKTSALPHVIFPASGGVVQPQAPAPPILTIGSSTFTANAATQFFIGPGQTLTPGGAATLDGTSISLDPSANFIVIGGVTKAVPAVSPAQPTARPKIVIGGSTITALIGSPKTKPRNQPNIAGNVVGPTFAISGQTLAAGHAIFIDGTKLSLPASCSCIVINGVTSTFPSAAAHITPPPLTVGRHVYSPLAGTGTTYRIGTTLLTPGGQIIVSGTTISLLPDATVLIVNGVTTTLSAQPTITSLPILTVGSRTYTAASGSSYLIDGQTLTPGGQITVSGTIISLSPGATALVVYGITSILTGNAPTATITDPPVLTIGSQMYTAIAGTGIMFVIGGQTLTPGGTITLDGTTIFLAPGATQLVYGSSGTSMTEALFPATTTTNSGSATFAPLSEGASPTGFGGNVAATGTTKSAGNRVELRGWRIWVLLAFTGIMGCLQ